MKKGGNVRLRGIKRLRQEVNFLEREIRGELGLKRIRKLSELNERVKKKVENCD